MVGAGKGAENGILIKGGEYLERTQKIDTVVFDKTGTLTKGEPSVTDIVNLNAGSYSDDELLRISAIAEKRSEHPLAQAVLKLASDRLQGENFRSRVIRIDYRNGGTHLDLRKGCPVRKL